MPYSNFRYFNSQVLRSAAYDASAGNLILVFRSGSAYLYVGVSEQVYHDLVSAASIGSHFHAAFRPAFVGRPLSALEVDQLMCSDAVVSARASVFLTLSDGLPVMDFGQ
ncbi:KTSC domain-containing protein [Duganella vulcania]|uniref:KTSC domain-containing protein n=1 Tax=Duganella vulcania TaxID=2692166 RepID=A0A845GHG2_9BURK|nr:KTSC domain-containing protein [Duganella vulcania]MYM92736.1 KTSC domain-containing protein [Duganella vulcania]